MWLLTHTHMNTIFQGTLLNTVCICMCLVGGLCSTVGSRLPREASQSQHSLGIGLSSWRVSLPQQDKQRPSSDRIWSAGHTVQLCMPGPRQSKQDGSHAWQFGWSLSDSEPWSNRRICYKAFYLHIQLRDLQSSFAKLQLELLDVIHFSWGKCDTLVEYREKLCKASWLSPVKWRRSLQDTGLHRCLSWMCSLHNRTDRTERRQLEAERCWQLLITWLNWNFQIESISKGVEVCHPLEGSVR